MHGGNSVTLSTINPTFFKLELIQDLQADTLAASSFSYGTAVAQYKKN